MSGMDLGLLGAASSVELTANSDGTLSMVARRPDGGHFVTMHHVRSFHYSHGEFTFSQADDGAST